MTIHEPGPLHSVRKKHLIDALRSGRYLQGMDTLSFVTQGADADDPMTWQHCCLGVASHLCSTDRPELVEIRCGEHTVYWNDEDALAPHNVVEWLFDLPRGTLSREDDDGFLIHGLDPFIDLPCDQGLGQPWTLAALNDYTTSVQDGEYGTAPEHPRVGLTFNQIADLLERFEITTHNPAPVAA